MTWTAFHTLLARSQRELSRFFSTPLSDEEIARYLAPPRRRPLRCGRARGLRRLVFRSARRR